MESEANSQWMSHRSYTSINNMNEYRKYANASIVEQCLNSLDVFKGLIEGLPEKKNRVIRDVIRTMKMGQYEEGEVVYQQGSKATEIYFLLHGSVNACILEQIEQSPEEEPMTEHKEIAVYEKGEGFGEGEFVSKSIRGTTIFVRESPTIVAKLAVHSFEEVIENYRMRVYYHKKDMFMENPLFQLLTPSKLDFILSNTKLVTLTISNSLVQQGEPPKSVYVVNKGQLCLFREKTERLPFICGHQKRGAQKKDKVMLGLLKEGCFVGDREFAMGTSFNHTAVCATEKAEVYCVDYRIIMSQLSATDLESVQAYYVCREQYDNERVENCRLAKDGLERKQQKDLLPPLTKAQISLKRKIMHRYTQQSPSLIGHSTPLEIRYMIDRKVKRQKEESSKSQEKLKDDKHPVLELFDSHSAKKRIDKDRTLMSPLPIVLSRQKKYLTEPPISPIPCSGDQNPEERKEKPLIIKVKPFRNKIKNIKSAKSMNMEMVGKIIKPYDKSFEFKEMQEIIKRIKHSK